MSNPLNPKLHKALERAFGEVRIANEGEPYISSSANYLGRRSSPPAYAGEYYCVSCPFCDDSGKHLWINHMWGVTTDDRDDHLYLAWCYRCEGISTREIQKKLYEKVFPFGYGRRQLRSALPATPQPSETETINVQSPVTIPEGLFSLQEAVAANAATYLRSRGFDIDNLDKQWGVAYCQCANNVKPEIFDRIVIPIYTLRRTLQDLQSSEFILAGWQSRCIGDEHTSGAPKYMCMQGLKKSQLLYGLPQAVATTGPIVIVEGVTDVWRLGSHAVCPLGKNLSPPQQQLMIRYFAGRPIVLFFDVGAESEADQAAGQLRTLRREFSESDPVVVARVPAGHSDVGECTTEEAWGAVWAAL